MIEKTRGIILRIIDNKDAGKFLILYTEKFGKITAIAYIPEKINSIALSAYEIGNAVEIVLYKKKEDDLFTVSQITLLKQYSHIRFDYDKYRVLNFIFQLILKHTEENVQDKQFMNFLKLYLNFLNNVKKVDKNTLFLFEYYFLYIQGILQDLLCETETEKYLIENLNKQVLLEEKLYPYITKNLKEQISKNIKKMG